MNKAQQFFQKEYLSHKQRPVSVQINGKDFVIPYAYTKTNQPKSVITKSFLNDFFDAQHKESSIYAKHNIEPRKVVWVDDDTKYVFLEPFALRNKNLSNSEIISAVFKKAEKRYNNAAVLTERLQKAYPDEKKSYTISSADVKSMKSEYHRYLWNKTKSKTKYGASLVADFLRRSIVSTSHKIADLTPDKLKRAAKKYALAALIGSATIGGGYKLAQSDIFNSDKIENIGDQNAIQKHNAEVFDESLDDIKTVLCFMENFSSKAFKDGKGVPTIGYGCTYLIDENGRGNREISPIRMGMNMTMDEAVEQKDRYLIHRVKKQILEDVKVPLEKKDIIASATFMYVIGPNAFKKSEYLKAMNNGVEGEELAHYMLGFAKDKGVVKRNWFAAQIMSGKLETADFLDFRAEGCYSLEMEDCCEMDGNRVKRDENGMGCFIDDHFEENIAKAKKKRSSVIGECKIVREILPQKVVSSVLDNNQKKDFNLALWQKGQSRNS